MVVFLFSVYEDGMQGLVDLHTHSSASDGTDSPGNLVALAAEESLAAIALTDHDTVSGLAEAVAAGKVSGVGVVRGCELAVSSPHGEIHLLGLWLPSNPAPLAAALANIRDARDARNREMVEKFRRAGFDVSYEELLAVTAGETVGRPHMARLLVQKGVCASIHEVFLRFLGDNGPMYTPRVLPSLEEGLALLQAENATTVLAHPMLIRTSLQELDALVGRLAALGLDALEAYYPEHDAAAARHVETIAARHNLALSGGSDYHGTMHPAAKLGRVWNGGRIPGHVMKGLLERRVRQNQPVD